MAAEDTKGKKRKGAPDAAPVAKKAKKAGAAPAPKLAKVSKSVPAPAESKPSKSKPARKQATDLVSNEEAPAAEPVKDAVKTTKNKKKSKADAVSESVPVTLEESRVEAQTKPKKQSKKDKVVVAEEAPTAEEQKPEAPAEKPKKAKKGKKADSAPSAPEEEDVAAGAQEEAPSKKSKKAKGSKKQEEPVEEVTDVALTEVNGDGDVEEDDQTAALLAGFESDDEDEDPEHDVDFEDDVTVPNISKKARKELENAAKGSNANQPGVIYVGRVPRGFFEPQMKKYFSQFGRVNRLRLSRNKKTGASKHFAFVEFASTEVADIVARTMDNYLLFGHILKCKLVPTEQVHPDLFKGAGQRFKVDPRNKKAGLEMERGVTREQWEKRIERENRRRSSKSAVLKEEFGYEYDAPNVKSVDEVPKQTNIVENGEPQQLLDDAPADVPGNTPDEEAPVEEHSKVKNKKKATKTNGEASSGETSRPAPEKKSKKVAKAKAAVEATVPLEAGADVVEPASETKSKKNKKRKSDVAVESVTADEVPVAAEVAPKTKKAKKVTKSSPAHENAPEKKRKVKAEPEATSKKAKKAKA